MALEEEKGIDKEEVNTVVGNGGSNNQNKTKSEVDERISSFSSKKGKSCRGCLYYSSVLKSESRNPVCVGITQSLPQLPHHNVRKSEGIVSKDGRRLKDFRYGCVGYSVYPDGKGQSTDVQEVQPKLPLCVGIEVLVDKPDSVPAHYKDGRTFPPQSKKPVNTVGEEFLSRFTRNAGIVARGVSKNLRKVGNRVKESLNEILYPYRKPPK